MADFNMDAFTKAINAPDQAAQAPSGTGQAAPSGTGQGAPPPAGGFNADAFSKAINAPDTQEAPPPPQTDNGGVAWQSSPLSLLPVTAYNNGSWDFDSNSGMLGAGKRLVQGAYNTVTGLPALAHQVGEETSANTATPETAGQTWDAAALATPGDMMAPGLSGKTVRAVAETPTSPELKTAGKSALNAARDTGVDYSIPHVVNLSNNVEQQLYNLGIGPADAPRTFAKLADTRNVPDDAISVPISGLMGIRRGFSKLTADQAASDTDRMAAATALGHFQGFLENPPPEAVLAGPASTASDLVKEGNANYGAAKRSDLVTNRDESAVLGTARANSGRNYDNTLRGKLKPLVDPTSPQRFQLNSFTDPEKQAVRDIVTGSETPTQNTLRRIGNLGGGGHGVMSSMLGVGAGMLGEHTFGPIGSTLGMVPPLAGTVARNLQNRTAKNAVEGVGETLRQRSPLYEQRQAEAGYTVNPSPYGVAAARAATTTAGEDPSKGIYAQPESGHPFYAKGGSVKKPTHEFLVQRLMKLAEKAKKAEKKVTAPILNMPDDTVTDALARAQKAL
jgi:hypothetical protein